jgi:hypothetical protein
MVLFDDEYVLRRQMSDLSQASYNSKTGSDHEPDNR